MRLDDVRDRTPLGALAFKSMEFTLRALRDYHRHEVSGLENVPRTGPALLVFNHSFATYDSWLFGVALFDETKRLPRGIIDRLMLRTPVLGSVFRECGFISASREEAVRVLCQGHLLGVVPGGMREALRSSKDKYRVDWRDRHGFVWTSIASGAPIVLAACPRADDVYQVSDLEVTRRLYDRFKLPFAIFRGLGPTLLPRPVKLWHLVSEPIPPPVAPEQATVERVAEHHAYLTERMNALMQSALELVPYAG
jgi:hypothetical protein